MPFASLLHCLCWCLASTSRVWCWPSAEWCQAGVSGLNKRVQQLMPAPGPCALLQVAWKGTSKNPNSSLPSGSCPLTELLVSPGKGHMAPGPWHRLHRTIHAPMGMQTPSPGRAALLQAQDPRPPVPLS